ncbi:Fibronectin [Channa argus]|uniref:Fibronectin n=1 Tax=Channa argus TaxID=215402 RepID=A0A6G1Q697_CHAAH|nr:Fibronectin [Channa argus]KAK2899808.1 hypothetical protein Q8A73_012937 [Channa argus]
MGRCLGVKVCVFLCCALNLMCSTAERLYFTQNDSLTWDNARNHCKTCFKDLVTVLPTDAYVIALHVTSDAWIGLRKYVYSPSNSTDNSTSNRGMPWSRWANGDPLAFQNWYPGWPVFKSPLPKIDCCSCSCTCPTATTPLTTSFSSTFTTTSLPNTNFSNVSQNWMDINVTDQNVTSYAELINSITQNMTRTTSSQSTTPATTLPLEAACVRTPMAIPDLPNPNKDYIEDSCVAMLSTGAWVEKNCTDLLPFVCYEDRFDGNVNVTNVTASAALLTWLPGPNGTSEYRLEVTPINGSQTKKVTLDLSYKLEGLTAGSGYMVKVFAIKCERDINNPQEANFYTIPNKVDHLNVPMQQDTSVMLSWNKPEGNTDFYRVEYNDNYIDTKTTSEVVTGLTPGTLYNFTVISGVNDTSKWSEPSTIQVFTKPGKVSNLIVSDNTDTSLTLKWGPPVGGVTGYRVLVLEKNITLNNTVVKETSFRVEGLLPGTEITFNVTAQANSSLEGETVTTSSYTTPSPVSNLTLNTTDSTLTASWNSPTGTGLTFKVNLQLEGEPVNETIVQVNSVEFIKLKTAANYTVKVYAISGNFQSPPVNSSKFTLPSPPTNAMVSYWNQKEIQIEWTPPVNIATATYLININSSFWGQRWSTKVTNQTSYKFSNLNSGTNYQFEVITLAGELKSKAATVTQYTVQNKIQISLSMMCSSEILLYCSNSTTSKQIYEKLNSTFTEMLGGVFWKLDNLTSENAAT